MTDPDLFAIISAGDIAEATGLDPREYERLLLESDWGFIIKANSILDHLVGIAILDRVGNPALEALVNSLPYANPKYGKLSWFKILADVPDDLISTLEAINTIRNAMAHRPKIHGLALSDYLESLEPGQRNSLNAKLKLITGAAKDKIGKVYWDKNWHKHFREILEVLVAYLMMWIVRGTSIEVQMALKNTEMVSLLSTLRKGNG